MTSELACSEGLTLSGVKAFWPLDNRVCSVDLHCFCGWRVGGDVTIYCSHITLLHLLSFSTFEPFNPLGTHVF